MIIVCQPNRPLACVPPVFLVMFDGWPFLNGLPVVGPSSNPSIPFVGQCAHNAHIGRDTKWHEVFEYGGEFGSLLEFQGVF